MSKMLAPYFPNIFNSMKTIYPILFFFIVLLSSCSENNNSSTAVIPNPKANFELKELLGRGEGLSQEEYKKIENK